MLILKMSKPYVLLLSLLVMDIGCYEQEDLGSVDVWSSPLAPSGKQSIPAVSSVLEATSHGNAGHAVAGIGDVNGDGFDDILLGDPDYWLPGADPEDILSRACPTTEKSCEEGHNGGAYLIYGRADGLPARTSLDIADAVFQGEIAEGKAGIDVSPAGDVNGDGFADFLIVAPGYSPYPHEGEPPQIWRSDFPAKVYIYYGRSKRFGGEIKLQNAPSQIQVAERYRTIAHASGVGDLNGDGFEDVAMVLSFLNNYPDDNESRTASVHVFFGKAEGFPATLTPENADLAILPDELTIPDVRLISRMAIARVGDINGDGLADFGVGHEVSLFAEHADDLDFSGEVYVVLGNKTMPTGNQYFMDVAALRFGTSQPKTMGILMAGVGDLNNDGFDDVALNDGITWNDGDNEQQASGTNVYIFMGRSEFTPAADDAEPTYLDIADADTSIYHPIGEYFEQITIACAAGDLDGDQFDDLLVGYSSFGDNKGMAGVFYGSVTFGGEALQLSQADAILLGEEVENEWGPHIDDQSDSRVKDFAGEHVDGAGDFNGDGFADALVGAPSTTWARAGGTGRVYLVPGGPQN